MDLKRRRILLPVGCWRQSGLLVRGFVPTQRAAYHSGSTGTVSVLLFADFFAVGNEFLSRIGR